MKPENQEELKKLVIKQYSEICFIKSEKLIDNMKQTDWWEKEKYRLKIKYTVSCIILGFVFACVLIVFSFAFFNHKGFNTVKFSFISVLFSMLFAVSIFNKVNQRKKIFEILELIKE
jgi:hypothetical protein